nr:hypothetical protein [Solirubrobacterales bacterium]
IAAIICALLLPACGGGDDSSTPAPADAGLTVTVSPTRAAPGGTVEAAVVNGSEEEFTYGAAYELERQEGNTFEEVKLPPRPVPEIGYVAKPGETGAPISVGIPRDALPGQYRVVIQRDVPDVGDLSGEFEVIDG